MGLAKGSPRDCGYCAHNEGRGLKSNPYPEGSPLHAEWVDGWIDAEEDGKAWDDDEETDDPLVELIKEVEAKNADARRR